MLWRAGQLADRCDARPKSLMPRLPPRPSRSDEAAKKDQMRTTKTFGGNGSSPSCY